MKILLQNTGLDKTNTHIAKGQEFNFFDSGFRIPDAGFQINAAYTASGIQNQKLSEN